jgi:hypothetical protein
MFELCICGDIVGYLVFKVSLVLIHHQNIESKPTVSVAISVPV